MIIADNPADLKKQTIWIILIIKVMVLEMQ